MNNIELQKTWVQGRPVVVDNLLGTAFTGEAGAHTFKIRGVDAAQEAVTISGTITGKLLAANNVTISLSGSIEDGCAVVTLTDECYDVPGRFIFSVYATSGSTTLCLYCAVGNVLRTDSQVIAYPTESLPNITSLMADLEQILADWPTDYSQLQSDVSSLKSAFVNQLYIDDYKTEHDIMTLPTRWVHGSRTGASAVSSLNYRITSSDLIAFDQTTKYKIASGFRARMYVYVRSTGDYSAAGSWKTTDLVFDPQYAYHVNIARIEADENTSEVADITTFASKVYRDSPLASDKFVKECASTDTVIRASGDYLPGVFVRGNYDANAVYDASYVYRVSNVYPIKLDEAKTYTIADGYKCRVTTVSDSGSVIATSELSGSVTLNAGKNYLITIRRETEDTGIVADINEFYRAVKHGTPDILYLSAKLIHGSRNARGVLYTDGYDYRVTSSDYFRVSRRTEYTIADGFKCRLTSFDNNNVEVQSRADVTGHIILYSEYKYVITISRTTEDTSETADIIEFRNAIYRDNTKLSKGHLRIMIFGHSYSADSWQYVPFILMNYGISCEIYLYYRGNDSIDRLVAEWTDTTARGTDAWGITHIRRYCHVDTRYCNSWDKADGVEGYSAKDILELAADGGQLDLITLQTAPTEVYFTTAPGAPDPRKGYEPYTRQAIKLINASYKQPYVLGWFCSYTRIAPYDGNVSEGYPAVTGEAFDNRVNTLKAAETIYKTEPFEMVIPAAAAVFSARTNSGLASTDIAALGNLWFSDAVHLQNGIPCYITNLTVVQSIFNKFFPGLSVMGEQTRLTDAMITEWNGLMPSIHGSVLSSSEDLYELAQKCAVVACEHPFDITPIYLATDTTALALFDTHDNRYWADDMIDTSNISNGSITEQSGDA